jgi:enoyl-CoA hydratase
MGELAVQYPKLISYLEASEVGDTVVLRLREDFVFIALDLESKSELWGLFDAVSGSDYVDAVVVVGTPTCFAAAQIERLWRHVLHHDAPDGALPTPHAARGEMDLHREGTGHQQLAAKVRQCRKPVVTALQGEVCTPFLGEALVCDFRVVAEGTVFRNRCHEMGLPPAGALARLLPLYVGFGVASDILLTGRDILAEEALELGLVNRVVPAERLEAAAVESARQLAAISPQAFLALKRLLGQSLGDLDAYYHLENQLIESCLPGVRLGDEPDH